MKAWQVQVRFFTSRASPSRVPGRDDPNHPGAHVRPPSLRDPADVTGDPGYVLFRTIIANMQDFSLVSA